MHARRTNTAQRDVGPDGHTTSASPADSGRVSSTAIPATIASNARSDGGASALTTAFDNACSTFDRFMPTDTTGRPTAGTRTELRSAPYPATRKERSCRHLASSENADARAPPVNPWRRGAPAKAPNTFRPHTRWRSQRKLPGPSIDRQAPVHRCLFPAPDDGEKNVARPTPTGHPGRFYTVTIRPVCGSARITKTTRQQ